MHIYILSAISFKQNRNEFTLACNIPAYYNNINNTIIDILLSVRFFKLNFKSSFYWFLCSSKSCASVTSLMLSPSLYLQHVAGLGHGFHQLCPSLYLQQHVAGLGHAPTSSPSPSVYLQLLLLVLYGEDCILKQF